MRLRLGLNFNFTVIELDGILKEIFKHDPQHPEGFRLPAGVVPLCNNSSHDRICAMMPLCDSHGIAPTWQEPAGDVVQQFFDSLVEVAVNADEKKLLTRDTTEQEMERIATREEEAAAAATAGEFGFTVEEADAASATSLAEREWPEDEEELASPDAELSEPAEGASGPPSPGSLPGTGPRTQPPVQPRRRLRRIGDAAGRQAGQQPQRRATRSAAASTVAAGAPPATVATRAGSSRASAAVPAKRPRDPTPPPRRAGGGPNFDLSALSSDEEEEEE